MQDPQHDEIEIEAIGIEVSSQPIELYKVLKLANVVNGGGEAKHLIAEGYVAVNGELETRKRRKINDGDLIEFNQEFYVVICVDGNNAHSDAYEYVEAESLDFPLSEQETHNEESFLDEQEQDKRPRSNGRKSIDFF